jgi:hypothetical protein
VYFIFTNQTTREYLKKASENHPKNPFSRTFIVNFKKFCTSSKKKSHFSYKVNYKESKEEQNLKDEDLV